MATQDTLTKAVSGIVCIMPSFWLLQRGKATFWAFPLNYGVSRRKRPLMRFWRGADFLSFRRRVAVFLDHDLD